MRIIASSIVALFVGLALAGCTQPDNTTDTNPDGADPTVDTSPNDVAIATPKTGACTKAQLILTVLDATAEDSDQRSLLIAHIKVECANTDPPSPLGGQRIKVHVGGGRNNQAWSHEGIATTNAAGVAEYKLNNGVNLVGSTVTGELLGSDQAANERGARSAPYTVTAR